MKLQKLLKDSFDASQKTASIIKSLQFISVMIQQIYTQMDHSHSIKSSIIDYKINISKEQELLKTDIDPKILPMLQKMLSNKRQKAIKEKLGDKNILARLGVGEAAKENEDLDTGRKRKIHLKAGKNLDH